jgi:hypothetical protein
MDTTCRTYRAGIAIMVSGLTIRENHLDAIWICRARTSASSERTADEIGQWALDDDLPYFDDVVSDLSA